MNLKKDLAIVGGLFFVIVVLLIFGKDFTTTSYFGNNNQATPSSGSSINSLNNQNTDIKIKTLNINAEISDTKDERAKGLSDTDNLPISNGMLFVFDKPDIYKIWMKDMKIPIDIIWISKDKKIVYIVSGAEPQLQTKDKDLNIYTPNKNALYVLEINAGLANANLLQLGDDVIF